jgi:hypothetical protein
MQIEFSNIELMYCFVLIPLIGVAWNILTDEGMLLFWYWEFLEEISSGNTFLKYITKPLGRCSVCLCGQIGFWFYFMFEYSFIKHIIFTCVVIAMISIYNQIIAWLTKN